MNSRCKKATPGGLSKNAAHGGVEIEPAFAIDPELQCAAGDVVLASELPLRDLRCRVFESRHESGDLSTIPATVFLIPDRGSPLADIHGSAPGLIFPGLVT